MTRDTFIFYRSFKNAVQNLPINLQLDMLYTIIDYALDGQEPTADGIVRAIFDLVRPQIDANNVKYINGCKGAEHGKKGAEFGRLGGRPKKATKTPQKPPKNPRNDNDNVNDNVNENVNENENDNAAGGFSSSSLGYEVLARSESTSRIICNCECKLSEADAAAVVEAFSKSEWLRHNITSLKWVQEHLPQITSGHYVTFEKPSKPPPVGDAVVHTKYTPEALNAMFENITDEGDGDNE